MPFLLRVEGDDRSEIAVPSISEGAGLLVGRGEGCDLVIKDPRLSRRHARFVVEDGALIVEDLGSPNGTFVNERRIRREKLRPGDRVTLGKTHLEVQASGDEGASEETEPDLVKPIGEVRQLSLDGLLDDPALAGLSLGEETLLDVRPQMFDRIARKAIHFAVLHEVSTLVQRERRARPMLSSVLDLALRAVGGDRAYAALLDDAGRLEVEVVQHRGLAPSARTAVAISGTLAARVIGERSGVISCDLKVDERFRGSASMALSDARSMLAVPILAQGRALGLLGFESSVVGRTFVEADLDLLSVIASTLGVALDNIQLAEKREETIRALEEAQGRLLVAQEELVKSEQLAVIGRFAAGVAHEVKNQLSPFMLADMIAREYPQDERIRSAAEIMLEAQQHILDLVNELRAFAQGSTTTHELEPHDLAAVVEGVFRFMQCDAKMKQARRTVLDVVARPVVDLNPRALRQVLVNLLRNAADAVPPGRGEITVGLRVEGSQAVVEVRDNGPGIPPEVAERMFEPFFSTKGEAGLGLGLDISRRLVAEHGGVLSFEPAQAGGTVFRLALPLRAG